MGKGERVGKDCEIGVEIGGRVGNGKDGLNLYASLPSIFKVFPVTF